VNNKLKILHLINSKSPILMPLVSTDFSTLNSH
jgi:hypothetical protein